MKNRKFYAIQQADRAADLYIFGDIVPFALFDGDVSAHSLEQQIKDLDVDEIRVHIDSYGGSVSEGWAIYNALRQHPAKVVSYGDGFVASAALYPFLAGDERIASNLSAYFLHQVIVSVDGNADDLRAAADEAETMTEIGHQRFCRPHRYDRRRGSRVDEGGYLVDARAGAGLRHRHFHHAGRRPCRLRRTRRKPSCSGC